MQVDKNAAYHEITVKGVSLSVPAPFGEGHVLKANEANVLNQTLAENLRNNFASTVADAIEKNGGSLEGLDVKALQASMDAYVETYEFGARRSGGGGAPKLEPRVRIALSIAKDKVKEAIRAKGLKVGDFDAEKITALAMGLVEKDQFFLAEADRRIKSEQKAAAATIDLDGLEKAA